MNRRCTLALLLALALAAGLAAEGPAHCGDKAARPSPAWVKNAVIYEVFTRSFSAEGSFREVEKALPRLKELGVTVVWLMPIHRTGTVNRKGHLGSPYATQDYYSIDPMYGTAADLKSLVQAAHGLGMRVVVDIVANHTGWDCVMMEQHPTFYTQQDGKIIPPVPDWTDVADLDYGNPELRAYMIEMLKYWVRDFDLDGYRCDVANMIPLDFWENARAELEKIKPELLMLAEGDWPQDHLQAFDLTYSWRFYEAMIDAVNRGRDAAWLRKVFEDEQAMFPKGALIMRFNDNHDKYRAVHLFGDEAALMTAGLTAAIPGVPMLYNGQEIGDPVPSNDPALFEKYDILWYNNVARMKRFQDFYAGLLALRRGSRALREGSIAFLNVDPSVFAFQRSAEGETMVVLANLTNRKLSAAVPMAAGESYRQVFPVGGARVVKAALPVELGPFEFVVFSK
jgi:cyclomaltodextrinase / maltogenic alpha-amylase / neopullulanase